jgi:hypothetical protein
MLESELSGEVENGRLVRLMIKLGFINERAESVLLVSRWEYGLMIDSNWIPDGQILVTGTSCPVAHLLRIK